MRPDSSLLACVFAAAALAAGAPPATCAGIADNSFFVEEAYNQEGRVVQHIQTFLWIWDRDGGGTARGFGYGFTQEWPLGSMRHQLSYTLPYSRSFGDQPHVAGLGDAQVHYRYQALEETGGRPAFAPRLSVYLPSGDEEKGLGVGSAGVEANLPVSRKVGRAHLHWNAGATVFPGARATLPNGSQSQRRDLWSFNLAGSAILLLHDRANVLLEVVSRREDSINGSGRVDHTDATLFSPGLRYAFNRPNGSQWVLGAAAPLGLSDAADDFGALLYLSFEHPF